MQPLNSSYPSILLKSQFFQKAQFPPKDTDLSGKVAIVTGANQGLGFESARQFLSYKLSHLIITVRSEEKGKATIAKLQKEYPNADIKAWLLDMYSYDSIQTFVKRVETELPRLDIAVLNAGRSKTTFELVPSTGHEENLQVNYLSTIFLATLLLPSLKSKSPHGTPGRLSIVSSSTAMFPSFANSKQSPLLKSFDDIKTGPAEGLEAYATSKLLVQLFVYKLVDYVSADDVVINLIDPGMVRGTSLSRDLPKILMALIVGPVHYVVGRSVKDGASSYLDATITKGKESHGSFLMDWAIRP